MLGSNLGFCEVKVAVNHFQAGMTQNFFQGEDIAAIKQIVDGKGMPAKMGMQQGDTGIFRQSGEE